MPKTELDSVNKFLSQKLKKTLDSSQTFGNSPYMHTKLVQSFEDDAN